MQNAAKPVFQKIGNYFATLDQSIYRATVAAALCLLVYWLLTPVYPLKHVDYMLNAVFVIGSLTKAATRRAAVDRAFATLFGIFIGAFVFLHASELPHYWIIVAIAVFLVTLIDYLFFSYYVNVAVMVCWVLLSGGDTTLTHGVEAYIVERVVTNAIGIGVCLAVFLLWPSKVQKFAFRSRMEKLIGDVKKAAAARLEQDAQADVKPALMEVHQLVDMRNLVTDEASVSLKGTFDMRLNRVILEIKAAVYNLNMLNDVDGKADDECLALVGQALGDVVIGAGQKAGAEQDDYAFNYHLKLLCRHLMMAERINNKITQ